MPAIVCEDLTVCYGDRPAVHHFDGSIEHGSLTAVVGPNGAGKTTLLGAIAGLLPRRTGRIRIDASLAESLAYLPQQSALNRDVPIGVGDLVALGAWRRAGAFGRLGRRERAAISAALARVGLGGFLDRQIDSLSTGQLQRALFARVLVEDARLILLDEPFNALDAATVADLLDVVREWHGEHRTVVAVLHDLDLVRREFPDTILLARGNIGSGPSEEVLTDENLRRARAMSESWIGDAAWCERTDSRSGRDAA
jgi:zinc/manganese transport system ATP-binding protein